MTSVTTVTAVWTEMSASPTMATVPVRTHASTWRASTHATAVGCPAPA
jgi:hypothetical protein